MTDCTYIVGHRNPDADAICSAIAYAAYKKAKGEEGYIAARCGNTNARINAVLKRFHQPAPRFLGDVTPRVKDIITQSVYTVHPWSTCAEALELMDRYDVRALPVVDEAMHPVGHISIFQLGEFFIPKPSEKHSIRHVYTSINDIIRSLKAEVLYLDDGDRLEDLYVRVGAMDIRTFGNFTHETPTLAEQSIIVVGDRYDIQTKSIYAGVRLLVITGKLAVEEDIKAMAKTHGVSLIVSPYDSATTSWVIRSAARVQNLFDKELSICPAEAKVSMIQRKVGNSSVPLHMVLDEEGKLSGIFTKTDLLKPISTQLVLVDHNEISQAVPGADQVCIREIIDHHRLGNLPSNEPILFFNEPVGSTCTIIADLFRRDGLAPEPDICGILMGGIISDTLNLKGPTTTAKDCAILKWLSELCGESADDLAETIFKAGSIILSADAETVIRADLKKYRHGDLTFAVSQVEELGFNNFHSHQGELETALRKIREGEGLYFATLLVTDINTQNSILLVEGDEDLVRQINYPTHEKQDIFELKGIVSRKKQLIPYLTSLLESIGQ
ncbi:MAG: putative manganese-dependent inorganic diphosphatase [Opitutales bacterium]|nr:putative manganese-dependent inorganic diphosphatase [Opitutales bacterium]